jgi:hypothetical protein
VWSARPTRPPSISTFARERRRRERERREFEADLERRIDKIIEESQGSDT